jgi:SWI/SNF-related matrix-associated actin-dependent regulator of chromatin subfamily A-like protein 1
MDLFPYQEVGATWLVPKRQAFLADDMGLGKSAQAIHGADLLGLQDILVICPGSVRINWQREFWRFSMFDRPCAVVMEGVDEVPCESVVIVSYDLLVAPNPNTAVQKAEDAQEEASRLMNYAKTVVGDYGPATAVLEAIHAQSKADKCFKKATTLARQMELRKKFLKSVKARHWDLLVLDEAHYIKERSSDRTRAIYGRNSRIPGVTASAERVWRLSGTPAPNNVAELYTHMFNAGVIQMPYWDFVFHFCSGFDSDYGYRVTGSKNEAELKQLLATFMLRRMKSEVMKDLPPITWHEVTVEGAKVRMPAAEFEQIRVADQTLAQALSKVNGEAQLDVLGQQGQSMAELRRWTGLAKLPACLDIIEEDLKTDAIRKIIIFGVHHTVLEETAQRLDRFGVSLVYGPTPAKQRQGLIDAFQTGPNRVFIGNVQAAGTGINLTAASELAFLEQTWVPSDNQQAAMRCHRIGQTQPVRVRVFSLADSSDEQVQAALVRKARELSKVL